MRKPFSPKLPPLNQIPPSERGSKRDWDKEFEDYVYVEHWNAGKIQTINKHLGVLFEEYLNVYIEPELEYFPNPPKKKMTKVKIKCKDGLIQIERVK